MPHHQKTQIIIKFLTTRCRLGPPMRFSCFFFAVFAACATSRQRANASSTNATIGVVADGADGLAFLRLRPASARCGRYSTTPTREIPPYVWFKTNLDPRRWLRSPIFMKRGASSEQSLFMASCFRALNVTINLSFRLLAIAVAAISAVFCIRPLLWTAQHARSRLDHAALLMCLPSRRRWTVLAVVLLLCSEGFAMDDFAATNVATTDATSGAVAVVVAAAAAKRKHSTSATSKGGPFVLHWKQPQINACACNVCRGSQWRAA